jgi:hypothetical protein
MPYLKSDKKIKKKKSKIISEILSEIVSVCSCRGLEFVVASLPIEHHPCRMKARDLLNNQKS